MAYSDSQFATKERIEKTLRRHVLNLLAPFGWSVAMLLPMALGAIGVNALGLTEDPLVEAGAWMFGGLYIVFVISFFMMQWIFWYMDAWILTQERLIDIQLVTLFNRRISQIPFSQIQDVRFTIQGTWASVFGFGDIKVQSAGKESFFELRSIPNARKWAQVISDYSESTHPASGTGEMTVKTMKPTQTLGEILVAQGSISHQDLTMALREQHSSGQRLGKILLDKELISREELIRALGNQYHIPSIDLSRYQIDPGVVQEMSYDTAVKYMAVPIARSGEALTVAIAEPSPERMGELAAQFDTPLAFMVADEDYIREVITGYYMPDQDDTSGTASTGTGAGSDIQRATLEELGVE
ncbi:MAG: PH domain-containing protein [Patescibacteria group bacterium]|nr:PH domain-containing protein [Patescibacteria group bacterium]